LRAGKLNGKHFTSAANTNVIHACHAPCGVVRGEAVLRDVLVVVLNVVLDVVVVVVLEEVVLCGVVVVVLEEVALRDVVVVVLDERVLRDVVVELAHSPEKQ
jgi:hypothetical protein